MRNFFVISTFFIFTVFLFLGCENPAASTDSGESAGTIFPEDLISTPESLTPVDTDSTDLESVMAPVLEIGVNTSGETYILASSETIDAIYYYTTDGTDPTAGDLTLSGELVLTKSLTVKVIAVADGLADSDIVEKVVSLFTPTSFSFKVINGEAIITAYQGQEKKLLIPSQLDGIPLTAIAQGAFSGSTKLKRVILPKSITTIGDNAFENCTSLKSVKIPVSVKSIGDYAFAGCKSLKGITIPKTVKSIGAYAFYGCKKMTKIRIANRVESIGERAFASCTSVTAVVLPSSIKEIGENVFEGNSSLVTLTLKMKKKLSYFNSGLKPKQTTLKVRRNLVRKYSADSNWDAFNTDIVSYGKKK